MIDLVDTIRHADEMMIDDLIFAVTNTLISLYANLLISAEIDELLSKASFSVGLNVAALLMFSSKKCCAFATV